jgi:hypothetical protein
MKKVTVLPVLIVAALALLTPLAQAQTTIGQLAPINSLAYCVNGPFDGAPIGPGAAAYSVPSAGLITSWSTNATTGSGQILTFKVYRPLGAGRFLVVGHDGPRTLTPSSLNTFQTAIPVQAGDVVGFDDNNASEVPSACLFHTGNPEDMVNYIAGDAADGSTIEEEGFEEGIRSNLTATLLSAPAISSIAPASGSIKGGTNVVVSGANFAEVKGVSFGSAPATSVAVSSEGQITAVSPPSASLASVPVTVTTAAGTATSSQTFAYEACVVPKLKGKKLKAAKKALRKAHCKIGNVKKLRGATAKTGRVVKQSPGPRKVLAPGAKVAIKLHQ